MPLGKDTMFSRKWGRLVLFAMIWLGSLHPLTTTQSHCLPSLTLSQMNRSWEESSCSCKLMQHVLKWPSVYFWGRPRRQQPNRRLGRRGYLSDVQGCGVAHFRLQEAVEGTERLQEGCLGVPAPVPEDLFPTYGDQDPALLRPSATIDERPPPRQCLHRFVSSAVKAIGHLSTYLLAPPGEGGGTVQLGVAIEIFIGLTTM